MKKELNGRVYYEDARGTLVPEEMVKPVDQLRDQLVSSIMNKIFKLRLDMESVKGQVLDDIDTFMTLAAAEYGVQLGGKKGNLTLATFDGKYRIIIKMNDRQSFTEGIYLGKELIDKCIEKWSDGANQNLKAIIDQAFQVNQSGKMDIRRVLALRKLDIKDPDWTKAMDIISDAVQVETSKQHLLIYVRDKNGQYVNQNMNLSDL
nr:DUF3164 family protein [uncultured Sphaerochaeta sp.]